eukprot:jgi/Hompol1/2377/HPOL_005994-RA
MHISQSRTLVAQLHTICASTASGKAARTPRCLSISEITSSPISAHTCLLEHMSARLALAFDCPPYPLLSRSD